MHPSRLGSGHRTPWPSPFLAYWLGGSSLLLCLPTTVSCLLPIAVCPYPVNYCKRPFNFSYDWIG